MQLTKTEYSIELLDKWKNTEVTEEKINELLTRYVRRYEEVVKNKTQRTHLKNYLKGLMSNLHRKSIEPIALSSMGEKGVRPLQQFITRSTFGDDAVLKRYQEMMGATVASSNGMLSVDASDFIKKGKNSGWCQQAIQRKTRENRKLSSRSILCLCRRKWLWHH